MIKHTAFFVLLALSLYGVAGSREAIPVRAPSVIDPGQISAEYGNYRAELIGTELRVANQRSVRVASYNVHKCVGMDFRRDPDRIAEVIRSLNADIVSLQEVLSDSGEVPSAQLRYIAKRTGMYMAVAGPTKRKKDGQYGNALLSRFPISAVRLHDISIGSYEPRGVIDADISIGNTTVRVINTHLGLWPGERSRQADLLLEILPKEPSSPLIVLGDLNGWVPGSPALRRLTGRLGTPVTRRTFPSVFPLLSLDRIWVVSADQVVPVRIPRSPLIKVASDHLPVAADVYLHATAQMNE